MGLSRIVEIDTTGGRSVAKAMSSLARTAMAAVCVRAIWTASAPLFRPSALRLRSGTLTYPTPMDSLQREPRQDCEPGTQTRGCQASTA